MDSPERVFAEFVRCYGSFEQGEYRPACEFAARRGTAIQKPAVLAGPGHQQRLPGMGEFPGQERRGGDEVAGLAGAGGAAPQRHSSALPPPTCGAAATCLHSAATSTAPSGSSSRPAGCTEGSRRGTSRVEATCTRVTSTIATEDSAPAEECLRRAEFICDELEHHVHMRSESQMLRGQIALARGDEGAATGAFRIALASKPGVPWERLMQLLIAAALIAAREKGGGGARADDLARRVP